MTRPELLTTVTGIVRSTLRLDPETEILPTTLLISELGAESIDMLDLACELEKVAHCELDFHKMLQEHREQGKPDDFSVDEIVDAVSNFMQQDSDRIAAEAAMETKPVPAQDEADVAKAAAV